MLAQPQNSLEDNDQGFTLIELLVVIIIIGILAAIAIPVFLNQRQKGVDASLKSDLRNMAALQETYMTDHPSDLDGIPVTASLTGGDAYTVADETFHASSGNFISVVPDTANGGYCIKAWNKGATSAKSSTSAMLYDSTAGGLNGSGGAC